MRLYIVWWDSARAVHFDRSVKIALQLHAVRDGTAAEHASRSAVRHIALACCIHVICGVMRTAFTRIITKSQTRPEHIARTSQQQAHFVINQIRFHNAYATTLQATHYTFIFGVVAPSELLDVRCAQCTVHIMNTTSFCSHCTGVCVRCTRLFQRCRWDISGPCIKWPGRMTHIVSLWECTQLPLDHIEIIHKWNLYLPRQQTNIPISECDVCLFDLAQYWVHTICQSMVCWIIYVATAFERIKPIRSLIMHPVDISNTNKKMERVKIMCRLSNWRMEGNFSVDHTPTPTQITNIYGCHTSNDGEREWKRKTIGLNRKSLEWYQPFFFVNASDLFVVVVFGW